MIVRMGNDRYGTNESAYNGHAFYRKFGKRFLDIILSGIALIVLSPVFLILCILVRVKHGSPVLFSPPRPGMNERFFHIYKFRSMSNAMDSEGKMLPEKDRITRFGKFLRSSSLDELPELLNILRGDMSIVGPRPLARSYLPFFLKEQRIRHSVRPGLTGLAQISGRNLLPWDQRMEKDLEYVKNLSFKLDCSILLGTVMKVLKRENIALPNGQNSDLAAVNLIKEEGNEIRMKGNTSWPEIGGFFWLDDSGKSFGKEKNHWDPKGEDGTLTFSGRAAIALALNDALKTRQIKKAYVPSYGCFSMLQAFIDLNIPYEFYDVEFDGHDLIYQINENKDCDLLLIMKYFGASSKNYDDVIHRMKQKGCVIIEDITHIFFDAYNGCYSADYHVASLRKWMPIPAGGYLSKSVGTLFAKPAKDSNNAVKRVIEAMTEKRDYIYGAGGKKDNYLKNYSAYEQDFVLFDNMLAVDDISKGMLDCYDIDRMKERRRKNAAILYDRLKGIKGLTFLNAYYDGMTQTPLFVPIMLPTDKRDGLRKYLIDKAVYCPIHWPEVVGAKQGIRQNELSLICDQRYGENDMNEIVDLIIEWTKANMTA